MEFLGSRALDLLVAWLWLAVIAWGAAGVGAIILEVVGLGRDRLERVEFGVFSIGVGLLLISFGVLILGSAGLLNKPCMVALSVLFGLTALFRREDVSWMIGTPRNWRAHWPAAAAVFLAALTCALPPDANDALVYHLGHAKEFIANGRIAPIIWTRESLWPYQTEMLFTLGLLLQGATLAQSFHWLFFILTGFLVSAFVKRFFDFDASRWAVAAFVFTPAVFAQSGEAYVDLSLAFFLFASFYAFALTGAVPARTAAVLSGIFCGAALGTKYLALGAFAVLFLFWASRGKKELRPAGAFLLLALGVSCVWYIRSWAHFGNPVYPFFSKLFGAGYDFKPENLAVVGMGNGWMDFLRLPWNLTMHPEPFGGQVFGPLFLMFAPLAFFYPKRNERVFVYSAIFLVCFGGFIFSQLQQARFFLALSPWLAAMAGMSMQAMSREGRPRRALALAAIYTVLILHGAVFLYRSREVWPLLSGQLRESSYLLKHDRSYAGFDYLRQNAPREAKILNAGDLRRFYNVFPNMVFYTREADQAVREDERGAFMTKNDFDFIWIETGFHPWLEREITLRGFRRVFHYDFPEGDKVYHYEIFKR